MKIQSTVTGKCYDTDSCVYILNPLQIYKYIANDADLKDILCGFDNKLVYVFDRNDTKKIYDAWCKHEL